MEELFLFLVFMAILIDGFRRWGEKKYSDIPLRSELLLDVFIIAAVCAIGYWLSGPETNTVAIVDSVGEIGIDEHDLRLVALCCAFNLMYLFRCEWTSYYVWNRQTVCRITNVALGFVVALWILTTIQWLAGRF